MIRVHTVHVGNRHLYEDAMEQHFRIRHDIYVGERKWMDLARPDGREVDQFDTQEAVYLLALEGDRVIGGSRLVPTTGPHLLGDVFPHLANVRGVPRRPDVFEWTRIFVIPARREGGRLNKTAGIIYCGILEFCLDHGITQISGVCEVYWIPRLLGLGWNPLPLGEPIVKDGMTVAGVTCDVTDAALAATRSVYGISGSVLVENASRYRLPAPEVRRVALKG
jgi:acyl-homoserine lactone synthase